jgi:prolyl 4-hydroxylase
MESRIPFREALARAQSGDPAAQYAMSSMLYEHGRFEECFHWLRLAATRLSAARVTLATFLIDGRRLPRDRQQAADLLQPLAAADIEANLLLSELHGFAALGGTDRNAGLSFLLGAARQGHHGALRQLGLLCVCHRLSKLAGPLLAAAALGERAVGEPSIASQGADDSEAADCGPVDWPSLQEAIPQLAADISLPRPEVLNEAPLIRRFTDVIPSHLLQLMIRLATPLVQPSRIADPDSREERADPRRNSSNVTFGPRQHDHVLETLERSISRVSGLPVLNHEFLQIIRYRVGEEFRPHVDYLGENAYESHESAAERGQRSQTVLLYLNDGYTGGETIFPRLRIEVKGRAGDLLHFHNLDDRGVGHRDSLHAGKVVLAGEKWIMSQWIRTRSYADRVAP